MNKVHNLIEFVQRRVNSFIFRCLMAVYGIFLVFTYENVMPTWIYIIVSLIYPFASLYLRRYDKIRLFCDFLYVFMIIYLKPTLNIDIYFFLILPVINNVNFTGNKRNYYLLYGGSFILLFCVSYLYYEKYIIFPYLPPIIFLMCINIYTDQRAKYRRFIDNLSMKIDDFYTNPEMITKPHEVYKGVIYETNQFLKDDIIDSIVCITKIPERDNYLMVNASKFIWEYSFPQESQLNSMDKRVIARDIPIILDDIEYRRNYLYYMKTSEIEYIFFLNLKKGLPFYYQFISGYLLFVPFFRKYSKLLLSQKRIAEVEKERRKELSNKVRFVHHSTTTMHFIRNRLSPLSNLAAIVERIIDSIPLEYRDLIQAEIKNSQNDLKSLEKKADYLLDKDNNPISFTNVKPFSIASFFAILKKTWNEYFPERKIIVINNNKIDINDSSLKIETNIDGVEIVFTDWIRNMSKYSMDMESVYLNFIVEESKIHIKFSNSHELSQEDQLSLKNAIVSNDRTEISRRKTHGIYNMKQITNTLDISLDLNFRSEIKDKEYKMIDFSMYFKVILYENQDINN